MKLIDEWKTAYRMFSVQAMAIAGAIQGVWVTLPDDMKAALPATAVHYLTMALLVFGVIGRLVSQSKP
jgi:hypothetical protein